MRAFVLSIMVLMAACSCTGAAGTAPPTPTTPTPTLAATCTLPVFWAENTPLTHTHAAFVSVPSGTVADVGIIATPAYTSLFAASYNPVSGRWLPEPRYAVSVDGTQYAYGVIGASQIQVHVVDVATGNDHVAYGGPTAYWVIAFGSDGVYLVHAVNAKQGVFEELFRLDPAGGTPVLVPGSNRHMDQSGWTTVSGGAAWGLDHRITGTVDTYVVERLDLATGAVTEWLKGDPGIQWTPMGTDDANRLYVTNGSEIWRLPKPGQVEKLIAGAQTPGTLDFGDVMLADARGVWFAARGGVWLYSDVHGRQEFSVGPEAEMISPAGPCT